MERKRKLEKTLQQDLMRGSPRGKFYVSNYSPDTVYLFKGMEQEGQKVRINGLFFHFDGSLHRHGFYPYHWEYLGHALRDRRAPDNFSPQESVEKIEGEAKRVRMENRD
jgi:hypothetical protein